MTQLTIVPRDELQRAKRVIRSNVINAITSFLCGAMLVAGGLVSEPFGILTLGALGCGGYLGIRGALHTVKALRARATVRAKLGAQELPAARLLGPSRNE